MPLPLLREGNIVLELGSTSPRLVLKQMLDALSSRGIREAMRRKWFSQLLLREEFGTTAIGDGIALPHCFSSEISRPIVAFGISPTGIDFPSLDGQPVYFVYLLILPDNPAAEKIKRAILQKIKRTLQDSYLQERLKRAENTREVFCLLKQAHAEDSLGVGAVLSH